MTKKLKKRMYRVIAGGVVFSLSLIISKIFPNLNQYVMLIMFLIAYLITGGDVVKKAVMNIGHGQVFDENFLMFIATAGAFCVSEYPEAVAVMLFYQVGEIFQSYAVNQSRKSIKNLMDLRTDYANVIRNGEVVTVDPNEVVIGEIIEVKPGEKIPLDGVVTEGNSTVDTSALTGESVPREVLTGDPVISGCVNLTGLLEITVEKEFGESTVAKIMDLVENASSKKAEAENFISKFAKYYTPIVVISALLLALIPPIIMGGNWSQWIYRALTFLVISCPCALVISIPLSFFGGLGGASKAGILIKGANYLEALAETEYIVMDKTGTLTKGTFTVTQIVPQENVQIEYNGTLQNVTDELLLELTAYVESYSSHPISKSLIEAYGKSVDQSCITKVEVIAGHGVSAIIGKIPIYAGNEKLMRLKNIPFVPAEEIGTVVHVATDNLYLGHILIADEVKEDAAAAVREFKKAGIRKIIMLTGDRKVAAMHVAQQVGIDEVYYELLPIDKVECMENFMKEKSAKGKLLFVGDGINDAPVLARADIGVAMGGLGSDAAIEAADVVIMNDEPSKIALAMRLSKKTLRIVKQNIVFAIGIKILVLLLAAVGLASMWAAVFADVGVAVIAILNAMRAMKIR